MALLQEGQFRGLWLVVKHGFGWQAMQTPLALLRTRWLCKIGSSNCRAASTPRTLLRRASTCLLGSPTHRSRLPTGPAMFRVQSVSQSVSCISTTPVISPYHQHPSSHSRNHALFMSVLAADAASAPAGAWGTARPRSASAAACTARTPSAAAARASCTAGACRRRGACWRSGRGSGCGRRLRGSRRWIRRRRRFRCRCWVPAR